MAAVRALARTARLLERAAGEVSLSQYRVLSAIATGEDRASRVAERFGLGRPAVSATIEALCREGLVDRTHARGDQRAIELSVTATGRDVLDRVEGAMVEVVAELCHRSAVRPPRRALQVLAELGPAIDDLVAERRRQSGQPR